MQSQFVQRGGTVFGVILGLAVGVSVAVAVAYWFGKQSPVVNKMQPKGTLSDAEESSKNKTWDPNAPLFGKTPPPSLQTMAAQAASAASAAVGALVAGDGSTQVNPEFKPAPNAPVTSASAAAKPKPVASAASPVADPLGDLLKAKAKATAAASVSTKPEAGVPGGSPAGDGGVYFVQIGAFKSPEDANAQKAKLALLGVETKITEREQSGKTIYRVRAGVYKKIEDAEAMKAKLDKAGFDTVLVKTPL